MLSARRVLREFPHKQHIYPNIYIYLSRILFEFAKQANGNRLPCGGIPSLTLPRTRERGCKKPPLPMGDKGWTRGRSQGHTGLTHNVIASFRRRRGNPVFPVAACLDCFAALAMTRVTRKSRHIIRAPLLSPDVSFPRKGETEGGRSQSIKIKFLDPHFRGDDTLRVLGAQKEYPAPPPETSSGDA